ncbi:MAG TPA: helix-turn-helix domain-containing protein [Desulfotomaculum sp.]|nr:helix-turn-helix domain-containing protein [Desulfotomaculum sp.]
MFTSWEELPLTLGVEEVSRVTGYGKARIRELCRAKKIPCIRLGRAFRIPRDSLRRWLEAEAERAVEK